MKILNSNEHGRAGEKTIQDFEIKYGIKLPEMFRRHLLQHNGGEPEPAYFDTKSNSSRIHGCFYGIHQGPVYSRLDSNYEVFSERVSPSMLPIASDPMGNQICIGISKEINGNVFFWDHEELEGKSTERVAANFEEFLSRLYEWIDPSLSEMDSAINQGLLTKVRELIDSGFPIESKDEYGRSPIERAAIHGENEIIKYLWEKGAELGTALSLAEKNAKFFPKHIQTVKLIKALRK